MGVHPGAGLLRVPLHDRVGDPRMEELRERRWMGPAVRAAEDMSCVAKN
jgi:hypothetical protein